ncbi:MAG TPA: hypothetical protein GX746_07805 [Bacteroidales bacterium]|nr:hypothetical protein [Bacteroidales bacterium]
MKILIILATVLFSLTLNAQEINGTYFEGPDSLSFNNNHVTFSIRGNDALGIIFVGEGNYEMVDDFIIINTGTYSGKKTKVDARAATKNDTIKLQLFNQDGYSIQGVRAEFLNRKNKSIDLKISDDSGIILYKYNPKIASIKVSDLLYDKITFEYEANTDYTIHLVTNRVLEDKVVVFKLIDRTDEKLTMKLLSTDFKRTNPSTSHLNKLEKKTKAIIDRTRSFEIPTPEFNFYN